MSSDHLELPCFDDFHVHLRQNEMMKFVTPMVKLGGTSRVLVMPNLKPPIYTVKEAIKYKKELEAVDKTVNFLMTLYLSDKLTPEEIRNAKAAGITGVKSYPKGVTTNSDNGIEDYSKYYSVFKAMEEEGLILHLHGEVPSDHKNNVTVLNAEEHFLKHLIKLHETFPLLRIILEHATTQAAIETVKGLGDTVACTITAHHLYLTIDDWAGRPHNYCKPVAKLPSDRDALRKVIQGDQGNPKFFLGSDSAPHERGNKECAECNAGVFTSPFLASYLVHIFDELGCLDKLRNFTSGFGSQFYKLPPNTRMINMKKEPFTVPPVLVWNNISIVPFKHGETLSWKIINE